MSTIFRTSCLGDANMIIDRRPESLRAIYAASTGEAYQGDDNLIRRIIDAFRVAMQGSQDLGDSEWSVILGMNAELLSAFSRNDFDAAAGFLRDPVKTKLLYGFEPAFVEGNPDELVYYAH